MNLNIKQHIAEISTTNFRILVTMAIFIWTAAIYTLSGIRLGTQSWIPSDSWLIFIAVMSGIDGIQYIGKRVTSWKPDNGSTTSSDVQELSKGAQTPG